MAALRRRLAAHLSAEPGRATFFDNESYMNEQITAGRTMQDWTEETLRELADGQKTGKACVKYAYSGALSGASTVDYALFYLNPGKALFTGYETIVADGSGLSGNLVLRHEGVFENGAAQIDAHIVTEAGSGAFTGLRGTVRFEADPGDPMKSTVVIVPDPA